MTWETVIGLEVHVQLATQTKLFCGCATGAGPPNSRICPVCVGLPGALPVLNGTAVLLGVRAALGLNCAIHGVSEFARKNYFYPDSPKGYQISQFDRPVATDGHLAFGDGQTSANIRINRLHLEDDAGKSIHDRFRDHTALDFNRAGTPLAEIVTEPDLSSPAQAREFLVTLKRMLRYLNVSQCNMEDGQLRVDGNLSVRRAGDPELGTKQEVKNVNSFAGLEKSLRQLEETQVSTLENGGSVIQATFSGATGHLVEMRSKEDSDDYRYFPDPDLPLVVLDPGTVEEQKAHMPEMPAVRRDRYIKTLGVSSQLADVLVDEKERAEFFDAVVNAGAGAVSAAQWVTGAVLKDYNEAGSRFRVPPERLAELVAMTEDGAVSGQAARKVFSVLAESGGDPLRVAEELGLVQQDDTDLMAEWVNGVAGAHPEEWDRFCDGEDKLVGFFMGKVMKTSRGSANPDLVRQALFKSSGRD